MANVRTFNLIVRMSRNVVTHMEGLTLFFGDGEPIVHRNLSRVAVKRYEAYYRGEYPNPTFEVEPCS